VAALTPVSASSPLMPSMSAPHSRSKGAPWRDRIEQHAVVLADRLARLGL
jgi:hypothetical protein